MGQTGQRLGMLMKRLLLCSLLFGLTSTSALAVGDDIHEKCLSAADYKGCIEVMSGASASSNSPIQDLVNELKVLSSRLESVSLSSLSERAIAFRDALSLVDASSLKSDYSKSTYEGAKIVDNMISALASAWQSRIYDATQFTSTSSSKYYLCRYLRLGVAKFNYAAPSEYIITYSGWNENTWVGNMEKCSPQEWEMIDATQAYISELTIDPEIKAQKLAEKKRRLELSQLAPWQRYLEENPDLKEWATANPEAAAKERSKFISRYEAEEKDK